MKIIHLPIKSTGVAFLLSFLVNALCAQTVFVSNTGESSPGSYQISPNIPRATSFTTDNQSYTLNSITLLSGGYFAPISNFSARIFSDSAGLPGSLVTNGLLSGEVNPTANGPYAYTASSPIELMANSTYWVVAGISSGTGNYYFNYTASTNQTSPGSWLIGDGIGLSTNNGATWTGPFTVPGTLMFSVSATVSAVPEPSTAAVLAGLAVLGLAVCRRRKSA